MKYTASWACVIGSILLIAGCSNGSPSGAPTALAIDSKPTRSYDARPAIPELPEFPWELTRKFNLPLNNPPIVPSRKVEFLRADDTVIGVLLGDEARAYPWTLLANYHAVNDYLDSRPIIVNLCEACNGGAAFLAKTHGTVLDFRPMGLKNGTWYGIDFQTGSHWYPFIGEAFDGPLKGTKLERIRVYFSSWRDWVSEHPHTTVAITSDEVRSRAHGRHSRMAAKSTFNPEILERISSPTHNPRRDLLPGFELVFGMIPSLDNTPRAYPLEQLAQAKPAIQTTIDGTPVLFLLQNEYQLGAYMRQLDGDELNFEVISDQPLLLLDQYGNTWNMWGRTESGDDHPSELPLIDGYLAKWYEWIENFPETELINHADGTLQHIESRISGPRNDKTAQ